MNRLARAAALCFSLAFAALPLGQLTPIDFDHVVPALFLPGILCGFSALARRPSFGQGPSSLPRGPHGLIVAWFAWALLGLFFSPHAAASLVAFASFVLVLLVAGVLAQISLSEPRTPRWGAAGMSAGSLLGLGLVFWRMHETGAGPSAVYGHLRLFGMHQMVGALSGCLWCLLASGRRERLVALLAAILAGAAMFWAGGRAPLIGFSTAGALWSLLRFPIARRKIAATWITVGLLGLLLSLPLPRVERNMGIWRAVDSTVGSDSLQELSSQRTDVWASTWRHIQTAPWLGHGADAYRFIRPKQWGEQPHNLVLQFASDYGLVGTGLLLAMIGVALVRGFRSNQLVDKGAACTAGGLLACAMLDGVAYHAVTLPALAAMLGLAARDAWSSPPSPTEATESAARENPFARPHRPAIAVTLGITLVLGAHSWLFYAIRVAPPPSSGSRTATLLRIFPSTTSGLWRWFAHWEKTEGDAVALEWLDWVEPHSDVPALFHAEAARIYIVRNNFAAAEREYRAAMNVTFFASRPALERLLRLTQGAQGQTPPDATQAQ